MKRIITKIMCIAIMLAILQNIAEAKVGDVIGYTKYSDISAYINHYPITSYNINGYTAVVAEDLRNYGFNVEWNGDERSLKITRNTAAKAITPYGRVYKYSSKSGQDAFPYLESDIVTYVNRQRVDSFNINGNTCVYMEALKPYGEVVWVPEARALKMTIDGLPMTDYKAIEEAPIVMYAPDGRTKTVAYSDAQAWKSVGWYLEPVTLMYAADGRTLYVENSKVAAYQAVGWYVTSDDAKAAAIANSANSNNNSSHSYNNKKPKSGSTTIVKPFHQEHNYWAEEGAVIVSFDPLSTLVKYKVKCPTCGKVGNGTTTTSIVGSKGNRSAVCSNPKCPMKGKTFKVVIGHSTINVDD